VTDRPPPSDTEAPRSLRRALAAVLLLAVGLVTTSRDARAAGADDKRACAIASEEAQLRRIHKQLRGTREQLLICARDVCPPVIKHDCEQWLNEVDASMPTVVISAQDADGHDVGTVRVQLDGKPFLEKLDGNAAPIDPGEHVLSLQQGDGPAIEEHVIIREGEKNRVVAVHLKPQGSPGVRPAVVPGAVAPGPSPEPPGPQPLPLPEEPRASAVPVVSYAMLGLGAVGIGLGVYFEVTQANEYSTLINGCSRSDSCKQADVNTISNNRVYGGVSLGVGIAAAGTGAVLLLTRRHAGGAEGSRAWLDVAPTHGGGSASLHLSF